MMATRRVTAIGVPPGVFIDRTSGHNCPCVDCSRLVSEAWQAAIRTGA